MARLTVAEEKKRMEENSLMNWSSVIVKNKGNEEKDLSNEEKALSNEKAINIEE